MMHKFFLLLLATSISAGSCVVGQESNGRFQEFNASSILEKSTGANRPFKGVETTHNPWWDLHVSKPLRSRAEPMPLDINQLMYLAVAHSNQIKIASAEPLLREMAVIEADSNFDWTTYLNTAWNDSSDPVGNTLTTGAGINRFNNHVLSAAGGARRRTRSGGQFDLSQRFGWQDNNSNFFIPGQQATSQLTLSYAHPLLRGRGYSYNNSLVILSQIDTEVAYDQFRGQLQNHLMEVVRAYWSMYLERATLAQQISLYLKTEDIVRTLKGRQQLDTQRTQFTAAAAALETRRSDLIRAQTAVTNAETRLRGLLNAPELMATDAIELIPTEYPTLVPVNTNIQTELQTAVQNRPEALAAMKEVRASATRLGIAQQDLMPLLNLVVQGYASGLQGDSDFARSFADQFSVGSPSYSVGFNYELPTGNRAARARLQRRKIEQLQIQRRYDQAISIIETEVDLAVRELQTSHQEIAARSRALAAAVTEAETIEMRWTRLIDDQATSGLNLESLLRAQERVTEAERAYVTSLLTYNLAVVNLKQANGTLLQTENVSIGVPHSNATELQIDKGQPMDFQEGSVLHSQPISTTPIENSQIHDVPNQSTPLLDGTVQPDQNQSISNLVPDKAATKQTPGKFDYYR